MLVAGLLILNFSICSLLLKDRIESWSHMYMSKSKNSPKINCSFLIKIEIAKREVVVIN